MIEKWKCLTLFTNSKGFLHYLKSIDNKTQTLNVIMIYFFHFFFHVNDIKEALNVFKYQTSVNLYPSLLIYRPTGTLFFSTIKWQSQFQYKYVGYFRVAVLPLWQSKSINVYKRQPPNKSYYFWHKNTFSILNNIHIQNQQAIWFHYFLCYICFISLIFSIWYQ